jgi:hypothetical protein
MSSAAHTGTNLAREAAKDRLLAEPLSAPHMRRTHQIFRSSTPRSPHSFAYGDFNLLETQGNSTCDPLLAPQNCSSEPPSIVSENEERLV